MAILELGGYILTVEDDTLCLLHRKFGSLYKVGKITTRKKQILRIPQP